MEIKYRLYPYPVLTAYSDDYKSSKFAVMIDPRKEGYDLQLDFAAVLTNDGLKQLIRSGKAAYVYHLECAQTGFRKVFQTDKEMASHQISDKQINGVLQICPFVAAIKDIHGYASPDFHEDYQGVSFEIESGCILAAGKTVTLDILKDIDELAQMPSIFNITKNGDVECKQMIIDYSGRKILIKLPVEDYYCYKQLRKTPQLQSVLNSMTIIPALIYVLEEIKRMPVEERGENMGNLWYRVLAKTLAMRFDCCLEDQDFEEWDAVSMAQSLINNPASDAFRMLTGGISGGDDE